MTSVDSLEAHRLRAKHCLFETSKHLYQQLLDAKAIIKSYEKEFKALANGGGFKLQKKTIGVEELKESSDQEDNISSLVEQVKQQPIKRLKIVEQPKNWESV